MKEAGMLFRAHRLAALYLAAAAVALVLCLGTATWDAVGYASGRLQEQEIPVARASLQDVTITDSGLWVAASGDPQILITTDQQIRTVTLEGDVSPETAEAYYGTNGNFSLRRRVWAKKSGEAQVTFALPLSGGNSVRIDPTETAGSVITVKRIVINARRPFGQYFRLRAGQLFALLVLPPVAAAVWDEISYLRRKKHADG